MNQILFCDWLPEQARWRYLALSRLAAVSHKKNEPESYILNPLLIKLVQSRWIDNGLVLFCDFTFSSPEPTILLACGRIVGSGDENGDFIDRDILSHSYIVVVMICIRHLDPVYHLLHCIVSYFPRRINVLPGGLAWNQITQSCTKWMYRYTVTLLSVINNYSPKWR